MNASASDFLNLEESDLAKQLEEHKAAINRINDRREYLAELRAKAARIPGKGKVALSAKPSVNGAASAADDMPGPSEAIIAYVRKHPASTRQEVMDNLVGKFKTASDKPRELLRTIIGQCLAKGKLEDIDNKLHVPKSADEK